MPPLPEDYLPRICSKLELSPKVEGAARDLLRAARCKLDVRCLHVEYTSVIPIASPQLGSEEREAVVAIINYTDAQRI
jgi:hypothetical protein